MNENDFRKILNEVTYPGYTYAVYLSAARSYYLQVEFEAADTRTGELSKLWKSRKWPLSPHMTRSEVVQTALAATLMANEHEAREMFKYKGYAIFGPHFDVDVLLALAKDPNSEDVRPDH